jgi:hypothetical protein
MKVAGFSETLVTTTGLYAIISQKTTARILIFGNTWNQKRRQICTTIHFSVSATAATVGSSMLKRQNDKFVVYSVT